MLPGWPQLVPLISGKILEPAVLKHSSKQEKFWKSISKSLNRQNLYLCETLLMVNFGQKTAIFDPWNFAKKKKKHQNHLKPPWNLVSFTKTDKLEIWNHFWFHENCPISKSSLKIIIWSLKLALFQIENKIVFTVKTC